MPGGGFQAQRDELMGRRSGSSPRLAEQMADTSIILVTGTDSDGDAIGRPATWDKASGPPPMILMHAEPAGRPALSPGKRSSRGSNRLAPVATKAACCDA